DDHRHPRRLGVVECLGGLRLHAVVRGHHEDDQVGGLGTTGPHGGERLVARGVDEGDLPLLAVHLGVDLVGADGLVMPPASRATMLVCLMASSSLVLPWSTWPMTVTTGGRGWRSASPPSSSPNSMWNDSSSSRSSSSGDTTCTL